MFRRSNSKNIDRFVSTQYQIPWANVVARFPPPKIFGLPAKRFPPLGPP